MEKIAITGGAGFLGSNIAKGLIRRGNDVTIVDSFSSPRCVDNLRDKGIETRSLKGDLKNYDFAKQSLRNVDTVYHFAAEVGSVAFLHGSRHAKLSVFQDNTLIDTNVFRACVENGVCKIIYPSSAAVYPTGQDVNPNRFLKEEDTDSDVRPEGGYGWAKFFAEKQLSLITDTKIGILRIFHAYGPNIYLEPDRSQVVASLIRKAIVYPKEGFEVWGDGTQRRGFLYIDDLADAFSRLDSHLSNNGTMTVNVGATVEMTVAQLAEQVVELSGKRIEIKFDTSKPRGSPARMPDLAKITSTLGWTLKTDFKTGLEKTYGWAEERLHLARKM